MTNLNPETSFDNLQIRNNFDISSNTNNNKYATINTNNGLINNNNTRGRDILVERLVDATSFIIETIWCNFPVISTAQIIPLRLFITETLKRSRTFLSTLKIAQLYLLRIRSKITSLHSVTVVNHNHNSSFNNNNNNVDNKNVDPATCGRRMFLASLIVASKYLQDKNYSNSAWSKICGLQVKEINSIERRFLQLISYNLYISEKLFDNWTNLLNSHLNSKIFTSLDTLDDDDNNNNSGNDIIYYNNNANANANDMNVHGNINNDNSMSMNVHYSDSNSSIHNSNNNIGSNINVYGFRDPNSSSIVLAPVIIMSQSKECRVKG